MKTPASPLPEPQHDLATNVLFSLPSIPPEDGLAAAQIILGICIRCVIICAVLYLLPWISDRIRSDHARLGPYKERRLWGKLRQDAWVILSFTGITLAGVTVFDLCRILFRALLAWA